ncbi:hypothetical protein F4821DRAFT_35333 [Hypoxylon rubiginosum]|uniref:Uncharacterized protein n=1 Tax=Hypoxylon rubiginosum TaxID=110542 RepID=A0ACC0DBF5_9PEZI|nr:hypothetical protein F4821DRAFT_35333 [Hypoxylon rubiginosum]
MVWRKVSDNRWEHLANTFDAYFIFTEKLSADLCGGREHYVLFSTLKLEISIPNVESALRYAWKQIRYEQPQLAATVEGMAKVYEVPDEKGLEQWLASTFIVSQASDAEELYRSVTPIKQATLYYLPNSSELAFRAHHHSIDGTGVFLFWHSYLSAVANPLKQIKFGDEPARLNPSVEEALGYPEEPTQAHSEEAAALLGSYAEGLPGIGPVSKLGEAPVGNCHNTELVFSAETTEALVKACKDKGITMTAAIHAAYIITLTRHADPKSKLGEYVTTSQFNLRPYLPDPYNSSKYAVAVYYTPIPYKVGLPNSYWDVAKSLQDYYQSTFKGNAVPLELVGPLARLSFNFTQTPEYLSIPMSKDALVSSLGIVERYVQREYGSGIKVKDIKMGIDIIMGMSFFFAYTFRDQLRLVYSFNDGYEEAKNIQTYMEEVQSILIEELLA